MKHIIVDIKEGGRIKRTATRLVFCGLIGLLLTSGIGVGIVTAQTDRDGQGSSVQEDYPLLSIQFSEFDTENVYLLGKYGQNSLWIPFQSNWLIEDAVLIHLNYSASSLLHPNATVSVKANGQEVASFAPIADEASHEISFEIPQNLLNNSDHGVFLEFSGYLPLSEEECENPYQPGQWLNIINSSRIQLHPVPRTTQPTLGELPTAIVIQDVIVDAPPVLFVIPDDADSVTLTAASRVAMQLGVNVNAATVNFSAVSESALTLQQKRDASLVIVGLRQDLAILSELSADSDDAGAIIQIMTSPWNEFANILVVSASNEAELELAGRAFTDLERAAPNAMTESIAEIELLGNQTNPPSTEAWLGSSTTLAQLGEPQRTITGTGAHQIYYLLQKPLGWKFDQGTQFSLHFSSNTSRSEDLAQQTFVDVWINTVYMGTAEVTSGEAHTRATFNIPAEILNESESGSWQNSILLGLTIRHPDEDYCQQDFDRFSTTIYADSQFTPVVDFESDRVDLRRFPFPLVNDQQDAPLTIVIPMQPTQQELSTALTFAAMLGNLALVPPDMAMLTSDEVSSDTHANSDLIILGSRARQPLVNTFVGDSVTQSANLINPALNDPAIGYVHLIESPWNAEREAILVYSESEIGFATAATQLLNDNLQLNESASVVVVNNEQPAVVLERREDILISTSPAQFPGSQNPASSIDLVTSEPDSSTTNSNTIINIPGDTNQPTSGQTTVTNQQSNDRDGGLASNNVLLILALILAIVLLGKIGNDIYHSDMF